MTPNKVQPPGAPLTASGQRRDQDRCLVQEIRGANLIAKYKSSLFTPDLVALTMESNNHAGKRNEFSSMCRKIAPSNNPVAATTRKDTAGVH